VDVTSRQSGRAGLCGGWRRAEPERSCIERRSSR